MQKALAVGLSDALTVDWPGDTRLKVGPAIAEYLLGLPAVVAAILTVGASAAPQASPVPPETLDVERLYRAMTFLDERDPGIFNIVAISEPDTRDVAQALAAEYAILSATPVREDQP